MKTCRPHSAATALFVDLQDEAIETNRVIKSHRALFGPEDLAEVDALEGASLGRSPVYCLPV